MPIRKTKNVGKPGGKPGGKPSGKPGPAQMKAKRVLTYKERFAMWHHVTGSLEAFLNGSRLCITHKHLGKAIEITERFGSPSAFGEAWIGYTFENGYKVAVKKVPLGKNDQKESYTKKQLLSGDSAWSEMVGYILCTILVMAKVCPNLPVLYKYFWCPKCHFVNRQIAKKEQPCLLIVNEMADGDLKMYLQKKISIWNPDLVNNCLFQIAAGLYALEKFYKMSHNDLHYANVLVHEIQPGGHWHYKIDGKNYYVPNLGYMFLLWDFGMIQIPGKIRGRPEFYTMDASPIPNETDIGRIAAVMSEPLRTARAKKYMGQKAHKVLGLIMKNETRQQSVKEVLTTYFKDYQQGKPRDIIDTFNMDISIADLRNAHPPEFKRFLR